MSERWAKRDDRPPMMPQQVRDLVQEYSHEMLGKGFCETPNGRYYLRCARALERGVCRRRLNHKGACFPEWEG